MNDLLKMRHQMEGRECTSPGCPSSHSAHVFYPNSFIQQRYIKYLNVPGSGTDVTDANADSPLEANIKPEGKV